VHYGSLFVNVAIKSAEAIFPETVPEGKRREPREWSRLCGVDFKLV